MSFRPLAHFITITKHRHRVLRYCWQAGLYLQGLLHDLSKYTPVEFIPGAKFYTGTRSPNELERRENGYSQAWLNHKGRNKHHIEYWTDYPSNGGRYGAIDMPLKYLAESVCDRIAACEIYMGEAFRNDSALKYYEKSYPHYLITEDSDRLMRHYLRACAEHGKTYCFTLMKSDLKTTK